MGQITEYLWKVSPSTYALITGVFVGGAYQEFIRGDYVQGGIETMLALTVGAVGINADIRQDRKIRSMERELTQLREEKRGKSQR